MRAKVWQDEKVWTLELFGLVGGINMLVQKGQFIRICFSNLSFIYMLGHRSQSVVPTTDEDVMMVVV